MVFLEDQWIGDTPSSRSPGNFGLWRWCTDRSSSSSSSSSSWQFSSPGMAMTIVTENFPTSPLFSLQQLVLPQFSQVLLFSTMMNDHHVGGCSAASADGFPTHRPSRYCRRPQCFSISPLHHVQVLPPHQSTSQQWVFFKIIEPLLYENPFRSSDVFKVCGALQLASGLPMYIKI